MFFRLYSFSLLLNFSHCIVNVSNQCYSFINFVNEFLLTLLTIRLIQFLEIFVGFAVNSVGSIKILVAPTCSMVLPKTFHIYVYEKLSGIPIKI